jgi:hypothetical protein
MMMRAHFDFLHLITLAIWACRTVSAISPITVKGSKLYDENGKQFYLKGSQALARPDFGYH